MPETSPQTKHQAPPTPGGSLRALMRDPLSFFLTITREYGDVVCYRPAPEPAYLVNHPDYIRHILQSNHHNYSKATYINNMFKEAIADGLLTSEGDTWLQQRRLMQPAFHNQRIAKLDTVIANECNAMLDRWQTNARTGEPVDIVKEMATLTLSITAKVLFGVELGDRAGSVGQAVNMGADLLEKPRNPRFRNALQEVDQVVLAIIAERRKSNVDSGDLLSLMLETRDEETGQGMDDQQVRNQVITLLLAGYETTANALTWTWFLLVQHPDELEKLRAEVETVLAGKQAPRFDDLARLRYSRMVFEEGMRIYPPAWIMGRKSLAEDEVGDFRIPANTVIAISPYTMHRHPGFWESPEVFDPERFTPERSAGRHRFAYLPFGGGPRQCIGNNLAMAEAQIIIPMVVRRYNLELLPDQPIKPDPLFILRPNREIFMMLSER
jgi:cytochrome P450